MSYKYIFDILIIDGHLNLNNYSYENISLQLMLCYFNSNGY